MQQSNEGGMHGYLLPLKKYITSRPRRISCSCLQHQLEIHIKICQKEIKHRDDTIQNLGICRSNSEGYTFKLSPLFSCYEKTNLHQKYINRLLKFIHLHDTMGINAGFLKSQII